MFDVLPAVVTKLKKSIRFCSARFTKLLFSSLSQPTPLYQVLFCKIYEALILLSLNQHPFIRFSSAIFTKLLFSFLSTNTPSSGFVLRNLQSSYPSLIRFCSARFKKLLFSSLSTNTPSSGFVLRQIYKALILLSSGFVLPQDLRSSYPPLLSLNQHPFILQVFNIVLMFSQVIFHLLRHGKIVDVVSTDPTEDEKPAHVLQRRHL